MRKHLFSAKRLICLGLAVAMSAALAGCGSDIKSKADEAMNIPYDAAKLLEDDFGGLAYKNTEHSLEVVCTKTNKAKLTAGSLKDLFSGNEEAYISDFITYQPVYEVEGYDDVYVAFINPENDMGSIVSYELYPDGAADSVKFDEENGIVYIQKSFYPGGDDKEEQQIGIQIMTAVDVAEVVPNE